MFNDIKSYALAAIIAATLLAGPAAAVAQTAPAETKPAAEQKIEQKAEAKVAPETAKKAKKAVKKSKKAKKAKKAKAAEPVAETKAEAPAPVVEAAAPKADQKETGAKVVFMLMEKKHALVEDLLDTVLIFKNVSVEGMTIDEKVSKLKGMGIIPARTQIFPQDVLRKGFAAMIFHRALELRGGLVIRIAGTSCRNCLRELAYLGIMAECSERDKVTGPELVGLLQKAKDHREENKKSL